MSTDVILLLAKSPGGSSLTFIRIFPYYVSVVKTIIEFDTLSNHRLCNRGASGVRPGITRIHL